MGSINDDLAVLLSRLQSTDVDSVLSEMRPTAETLLMVAAAAAQPSSSTSAHRHAVRPLLSSAASLSDTGFYQTDAVTSPELRFNSAPDRLEDIFASLKDSHMTAQQPFPMIAGRPGNRLLDRRTLSVDTGTLGGPLQHQQSVVGYRKSSDVNGWDVPGSASDAAPPAPQRYKTELCRPFEENGTCRYGAKCQFAHGRTELRTVARHPKYKTEMCRTFHTTGYCPYGPRCHFIHNDDAPSTDQQAGAAATTPHHHQQQQQHHHHRHQLSRQSSLPVTSSTGTVEPANAFQKDIERRRSQVMQLQLQIARRRSTIDEISDEAETMGDWCPTSNVDRRQSGFASTSSVQPPISWVPPIASSTSSSSPSSSSSASSPVSTASVGDYVMPYVIEPPPGLTHPQTTADSILRNSPRSVGGCSPTSDVTSSSIGSVNLDISSSSSSSAAYHQMIAAVAGQRNIAGRPLLPANSLPVSLFPDDQIPVSSASLVDRYGVTSADVVSMLVGGGSSPCGVGAEVATSAWLSGCSAGDRRAAFSSPSWAKHSVDDSGNGASFDDVGDQADVHQLMASLTPDQRLKLVKIVKAYAPTSGAAVDVSAPAAIAPPPPHATTPAAAAATWRHLRSMSVNDPSMMPSSRQVDGHTWDIRQAMTSSPSFRAAGVCG